MSNPLWNQMKTTDVMMIKQENIDKLDWNKFSLLYYGNNTGIWNLWASYNGVEEIVYSVPVKTRGLNAVLTHQFVESEESANTFKRDVRLALSEFVDRVDSR